jgi:hypothetical protein
MVVRKQEAEQFAFEAVTFEAVALEAVTYVAVPLNYTF